MFDSFAGTVNTVLDIDRKEMERAAEMDILNWQAKFRVESDQFMNDLYRTTDENWSDQYTLAEQWDDRLNQFLSTTRDNLKNANPYMQRQIEQMLTGYEATLRNDLRSKASAKMNEHAVLTMQDTADINRRTLNGQERINANGEVYRQAYMNGTIDETNPFLTTGFILRQLITARRRFGHRARRTPGASDTRNSPLTRLTSPSTRLSRTATFIYSREPLRPEAGQ